MLVPTCTSGFATDTHPDGSSGNSAAEMPVADTGSVRNDASYTQRATLPDAAVTRTFDIDCTLQYEVAGPTDFLFQIHAHDGT